MNNSGRIVGINNCRYEAQNNARANGIRKITVELCQTFGGIWPRYIVDAGKLNVISKNRQPTVTVPFCAVVPSGASLEYSIAARRDILNFATTDKDSTIADAKYNGTQL